MRSWENSTSLTGDILATTVRNTITSGESNNNGCVQFRDSPQKPCLHFDLPWTSITTPFPSVTTHPPAERGPVATSEGKQTLTTSTCTHTTCTLYAENFHLCVSAARGGIYSSQFSCNSISLHDAPVILSWKCVVIDVSDHPTIT